MAAALVMAAVCIGIEHSLFAMLAPDRLLRWVGLAVLVGGGVAAYLAVAELLGACDLREMMATLLRRRSRAAVSG